MNAPRAGRLGGQGRLVVQIKTQPGSEFAFVTCLAFVTQPNVTQ